MDDSSESNCSQSLPSFGDLAQSVLNNRPIVNCDEQHSADVAHWLCSDLQFDDSFSLDDDKTPEDASSLTALKKKEPTDYLSALIDVKNKVPEEYLPSPLSELEILQAVTHYIKTLRQLLEDSDGTSKHNSLKANPEHNNGRVSVNNCNRHSQTDNVTTSTLPSISKLKITEKQEPKYYTNDRIQANIVGTHEIVNGYDDENGDDLLEKFSTEYPALASVIMEQVKDEEREAVLQAEAKSTDEDEISHIAELPIKKYTRKAKGPKRPKNGFIRFSVEQRRILAEDNQHLDNREVSRMLGIKWRRLSTEEKKPYEQEFQKDIQELRDQNPTWRYAPMKRIGHDQMEPMPSRLRPRDKLKRKFLPLVRGTVLGRKRTRRNTKKKSSPVQPKEEPSSWIQCDFCSKWRRLVLNTENHAIADKIWFCQMNPDLRYNSCLSNEEWNPKNIENQPTMAAPETQSMEFNSPTKYFLFREPSW